jgi:hypothetical protein
MAMVLRNMGFDWNANAGMYPRVISRTERRVTTTYILIAISEDMGGNEDFHGLTNYNDGKASNVSEGLR